MARTQKHFVQVYQNGYDLTGEARSLGPITWEAGFSPDAALGWEAMGGLCEQSSVTLGQVNTILRHETLDADSPNAWIHSMDQATVFVAVPFGIGKTAVLGDPVAQLVQVQRGSLITGEGPLSTLTINYESSATDGIAAANTINYAEPWGVLLHPKGSETAANTAVGWDNGAASTHGAWMMAQILSITGAGDVTIKVQDAATNLNGSFADVTGLTTGAVTNTSAPVAKIAQTAVTATIRQFTRWQIVFNGSTACTFVLSLVRGR